MRHGALSVGCLMMACGMMVYGQLLPTMGFAATQEILEFGLFEVPHDSTENYERYNISGEVGGIKNFIIRDSRADNFANDLNDMIKADAKFYTGLGVNGYTTGANWANDNTCKYNNEVVNEWVLKTSGKLNVTGTSGKYVGQFTVSWSPGGSDPEGTLTVKTPYACKCKHFKEIVKGMFDRHHKSSYYIYKAQADIGAAKYVSGIFAGDDQQSGYRLTPLYNQSERFHSLLRGFKEAVRLHNQGDSTDSLVNLDWNRDIIVETPTLLKNSKVTIVNAVDSFLSGSTSPYNLAPAANTASMYSHVTMRYDEEADPFERLDCQVGGAVEALSHSAKIFFSPQLHQQDWYEAVVKRMPQTSYEGVGAMGAIKKAWAYMYPDGQMVTNQFYYALASGASKMVFYNLSEAENNNSYYTSLDDDNTFPNPPFTVKTSEPTNKERHLGLIQLMWEAQNLKNIPKYIINGDDDDFNSNDPPIRFISNVSSQPYYRTVQMKKKVTETCSYHDVLMVFHWDQSSDTTKTLIYTHPDVIRKTVQLSQVVDSGVVDLDSRYSEIYKWSNNGLTRVAKVNNTFTQLTIKVNEDRPVILICQRFSSGTPYDDGSSYDLDSLYKPSSVTNSWKTAMLNHMGSINTEDGYASGTLLDNMNAISGFIEPGFDANGCYRETVGSDSVWYYARSNLNDGKDNCVGDGATSDYAETLEALRFLDYKRRQNFISYLGSDNGGTAYSFDYRDMVPVVGDVFTNPDIQCESSDDSSLSANGSSSIGDQGCVNHTRAIGNFKYLYKKWNYYFRFANSVPASDYCSHSNESYPWLESFKHWCNCADVYP